MAGRLLRYVGVALVAWAVAARGGEPSARDLEAEIETKLAERHRRSVALAQLYYAAGDWRRAAEHYEAARRIRDEDLRVLTQLTRLYASHRDYRRLLSPLQALVRLQPRSIGWLRELGSCYYRLGQTEKAEATWRRMLDVYPNRASAYRYLAQAYETHGLTAKAIEAWQQAVAASQRDDHLRLQLAEALSDADRHVEAVAALAPLQAGGASSRSRQARKVINTAYFELDLPRPVRAAVARLLDGTSRSPADVAWAIARAFEQAGEPRRAAAHYQRVADHEPKTERGKTAAAKARALAPKP